MAGRGLPRRTTLVAWDVDNIRPRPGQFGSSVKSVLCAPQVTLVGGSTDVVLAANTRTLSQIVPDREEIDELIRWGLAEGLRVEVIETEQRRQAVDRVLTQRIIDFADSNHSEELCLYVVSNDSDFAPVLAYAGTLDPSMSIATVGTCRPSKNSNAQTRKPNAAISKVAHRTLAIGNWGDSDRMFITEL